jgi:septum formation protein
MKQIILASQSPRRKQLMELAGLTVTVKVAPVEEIYPAALPNREVAQFLATLKADAVWNLLSKEEQNNTIVVASDTIVYADGIIYGKPQDRAMAIDYLKALNAKTHQVITGVSVITVDKALHFDDVVEVTFRDLSDKEIQHYVDVYKPYDKAGAYAIQEWIGAIGISKINGDYYSVMGLPINRVRAVLMDLL